VLASRYDERCKKIYRILLTLLLIKGYSSKVASVAESWRRAVCPVCSVTHSNNNVIWDWIHRAVWFVCNDPSSSSTNEQINARGRHIYHILIELSRLTHKYYHWVVQLILMKIRMSSLFIWHNCIYLLTYLLTYIQWDAVWIPFNRFETCRVRLRGSLTLMNGITPYLGSLHQERNHSCNWVSEWVDKKLK
jgi:hypothetical protein